MTRDEARVYLLETCRWAVRYALCEKAYPWATKRDTFFVCLRDGERAEPGDWEAVDVLVEHGGHVGAWGDFRLFRMEDVVD